MLLYLVQNVAPATSPAERTDSCRLESDRYHLGKRRRHGNASISMPYSGRTAKDATARSSF